VLLVDSVYIHGDQHGFSCVARASVVCPLEVRPVNSTVLLSNQETYLTLNRINRGRNQIACIAC
jgi:hypothetical protein